MTENLSKLTSSRTGYRSHLTKTLNKARDIMKRENPTDLDIVSLEFVIEQLGRKKTILTGLDEKIAALIEDPNELEQEIFDTEEIQDEIQETSRQISRFIQLTLSTKKTTQQPLLLVNQELTQLSVNETPLVTTTPLDSSHVSVTQGNPSVSSEVEYHGIIDDAAVENTNQQNFQSPNETNPSPLVPQLNSYGSPSTLINISVTTASHSCRLPKLNLPTFSGDPLNWFTIWDSFDTAVNCNTTLGGVQTFSYLKAQLEGDARRAITGFPLTNANYEQAVKLLKERFGHLVK